MYHVNFVWDHADMAIETLCNVQNTLWMTMAPDISECSIRVCTLTMKSSDAKSTIAVKCRCTCEHAPKNTY